MDSERALLKHYLAAIAYRTQKALRDAPADYPDFSAGHRARTPVEILRHMTSVLGYARTLFLGGSYPFTPEPLPTFRDEVARFHDMVAAFAALLDDGVALREISYEQLLQGPLSDVMTHVGQLALFGALRTSRCRLKISSTQTSMQIDLVPISRRRLDPTSTGPSGPNLSSQSPNSE